MEPGTVIGSKYVLLRCSVTGMRPSWLARDTERNLLRTLHLMRPLDGAAARDAFVREMERASQIENAHLVSVLDYGWDGSGYLFTAEEEYRDTPSLADLLEERDFNLVQSVDLALQLLTALEAVHAAGLVHGDIQPNQLLIRRSESEAGRDHLLLRGLGRSRFAPSRVISAASELEPISVEWVVGSPEYASPEQLRGEPHDVRSDLYSVGLLLYRLVTGRNAFAAPRTLEVAFMQRFTFPPLPSMYVALSSALEGVCLKALSKTPELRYQTAAEMRGALLAAHPAPRLEPVAERPSRFGLVLRRPTLPPAPIATSALLLPAGGPIRNSTVPAGEMRQSEVPRPAAARQRSKLAVPLMFGMLTFSLTTAALVAAPRLDLWPLTENDADALPPSVQDHAELFDDVTPLPAEPEPPAVHTSAAVLEAAPRAPEQEPEPEPADERAPEPAPSTPVPSEGDPAGVASAQPAAATAAPPHEATQARTVEKVAEAAPVEPERELPKPDRIANVAKPARAPLPARVQPETPAAAKPVRSSQRQATTAAASVESTINAKEMVLLTPRVTEGRVEAESFATPPAAAAVPEAKSAPARAPAADVDPANLPVTLMATPTVVTIAPAGPRTGGVSSVRVTIGRARSVRGAVSKGGLRDAINVFALERCYLNSPVPAGVLRMQLELETELSGRIASAKLFGAVVPPKLASCVEDAVRKGKVRDADTGAIHATVDLTFEAR